MVKSAVVVSGEGNPERALALSYARTPARAGLAALLALDARLGAIVRRTGDPTIGLMRLTWWAEALAALDAGPPPAEPVLRALAATVGRTGVAGGALATMIDGWEVLLDPEPLDAAALAEFGAARGGRLFTAAAVVLGGKDARVETLGAGWALADLARHLTDREAARAAHGLAGERLAACFGRPWPPRLRALGALGLLARSDLAGGRQGAPGRVGRLLIHRLTGR